MALDRDQIEKPIRRLRKFVKKASKRPGVETIHDVRTSSRRLETAIDALGLSSKRNERRALRDVRRTSLAYCCLYSEGFASFGEWPKRLRGMGKNKFLALAIANRIDS